MNKIDKCFRISIGEIGIFEPKEDITAIEVARICQLFIIGGRVIVPPDGFKYFINKYNLGRHFKEEEL